MHEHCVGLGLGQDVLPFRAIGIAAKYAGEIALIAAIVTADAGKHMRLSHRLSHGAILPNLSFAR